MSTTTVRKETDTIATMDVDSDIADNRPADANVIIHTDAIPSVKDRLYIKNISEIPIYCVKLFHNTSDLDESWMILSGEAELISSNGRNIDRNNNDIFHVFPFESISIFNVGGNSLKIIRYTNATYSNNIHSNSDNKYLDHPSMLKDARHEQLNIFVGRSERSDIIDRDILKSLEPRGNVPRENLSDDELVRLIAHRLAESPAFAERVSLTTGFMQKSASQSSIIPTLPLLNKAPRLWVDRPDDERGMNPAAWIRMVYAPWLGQGLARHQVGELDPELGKRYSNWIRKDRYPQDAITEFAEGNPYGRLDDAEAGRRHREGIKASKAKKADKMSHSLKPDIG